MGALVSSPLGVLPSASYGLIPPLARLIDARYVPRRRVTFSGRHQPFRRPSGAIGQRASSFSTTTYVGRPEKRVQARDGAGRRVSVAGSEGPTGNWPSTSAPHLRSASGPGAKEAPGPWV